MKLFFFILPRLFTGLFIGFLISFSGVSAAASETPESIVAELQGYINMVFHSINECGPVIFGMSGEGTSIDEVDEVLFAISQPHHSCVAQALNNGIDKICESKSRLLEMEMEIPEYSYELERVEEAIDEVLDIEEDYRIYLSDRAAGFQRSNEPAAARYESIFTQAAAQECGG